VVMGDGGGGLGEGFWEERERERNMFSRTDGHIYNLQISLSELDSLSKI